MTEENTEKVIKKPRKKRPANIRICSKCKNDIDILKDDYLKEKTLFIHKDCFIEKKLRRNIPMKAINDEINTLKELMQQEQKAIIEKQSKKNNLIRDKIKDKEIHDQLSEWLMEQYDLNGLDNYFYMKLAQINTGTYKDLKERITYDDLFYMFKTKKSYLDKIADKKERTGKGFKDNKSRLNFDLAVIINMYDSYKQWKEKQKLLEVEEKIEQEKLNQPKIDYTKINQVINKNNKNNSDDGYDISSILEDIY